MKIYEVEMEPIAEGQRFCQHIMAETPEEASRRVQEQQQRRVIDVREWRDYQPGET